LCQGLVQRITAALFTGSRVGGVDYLVI